MIRNIAAIAALLIAAPVTAQNVKVSQLPTAAPLTGTEKVPATQNGATVAITPTQIVTLAGQTFQPLDDDLTAIAALPTSPTGRDLLTAQDAASIRSKAQLGTIATQNANGVSISGGTISGITDLAIADGGTGASSASAARLNLGAAASGANADITSITGSAARLTTARTINGVGFDGSANITINAVDATPRAAVAGQAFTGAVSAIGGVTGIGVGTGNTTGIQIDHRDTFASANTENRLDFTQTSGLNLKGRIANYWDGASGWGFKIYVYNSTISSTSALTIKPNSSINFSNVPTYASDSAAGTGGLVAGDVYKTSDGASGFTLKIKG